MDYPSIKRKRKPKKTNPKNLKRRRRNVERINRKIGKKKGVIKKTKTPKRMKTIPKGYEGLQQLHKKGKALFRRKFPRGFWKYKRALYGKGRAPKGLRRHTKMPYTLTNVYY